MDQLDQHVEREKVVKGEPREQKTKTEIRLFRCWRGYDDVVGGGEDGDE